MEAESATEPGRAAPPGAPGGPARLWVTFTLTWVNNLGAATALIAVYFIAKSRFGFTDRENLLLGLVQGVTYIAAALAAGAGSRLVAGPERAMTTRGLLALLQVLLAAMCVLPLLSPGAWSVWLLVGIYSPLTGWLWPIIESYFSAGRSGAPLRTASSFFNLGWASSQVVTFWLISPFLKSDPPERPLWALAAFGASHLLCAPLVLLLPREPGRHDHEDDPALTPAERADYRRLLVCFRTAIVLSYVVYSSMNPLLPRRMESLGIAPGSPANTQLTSVWMASRVVMFVVMGAWGGWHGKRHALAWSLGLLLAGFAGCMVAPNVPLMAAALTIFGAGMGAVYSAAFYYAMEVGSAAVDAGGKHEALIGLGYTAGPLAGLAAGGLIAGGVLGESRLPAGTLAVVVIACVPVIGFIARRAAARDRGNGGAPG